MGKIGKTGKRSCCDKESVSKGAWSLEEDQILTNYIKIHGEGKWRSVAQNAGLKRYGKSCRLRWLNYLRPGIKRGDIAADEEDLIVRLHRLLGNRWALIAGRLPGRTDNEIKNYWNTILVKKLQGQELTPSVKPLKIDEKKPIEDFAPCTPSGIKTMAYHSPKEGKNLINNICDGHIQSPTTPIEDDSLNFFMDIDVDKVLFQDVFNSDFLQIHHDKMLKMGNMIDENEVGLSSSSCSHSANEVALENGIKNDSLEPTLDVELKRVTSFLDLEDEWELFCRREES